VTIKRREHEIAISVLNFTSKSVKTVFSWRNTVFFVFSPWIWQIHAFSSKNKHQITYFTLFPMQSL